MTDEFFQLVPRTFVENLRWRIAIRERAQGDVGFQQAMLSACKHDILFFLAGWCWLYEPRPKIVDGRPLPKTLPFLPWSHQIPVILELRKHLGFADIQAEKSRGEGFSWMLIYLALHDWLFDPGAKVGIISRTEEEADDPDNSDSLFWKIDWALEKMPNWMSGTKKVHFGRNATKHSLSNYRNGAQINADAATGDVFRGGRLKWAAMDEFAFFHKGEDRYALASSQGATNSRLFVSTVNGTGNEFHRISVEPSSTLIRIVMDWKDNPSKNRGLYRVENNKPVAVDPENNPLAIEYQEFRPEIVDLFSKLRARGFNLESGPRSPWYDRECDRPGATPQSIAQELDRDYGGSMARCFGHDFMAKAESKLRRPLIRGNLIYHPETLEPEFDRSNDGPIMLWCSLNHENKPPARQYVIGGDVATGLGGAYTSNSALEVIDLVTMEQVLEFASNTIPPSKLADLSIAMAKWFYNAYLAWEINGPGRAFTLRIQEKKYGNVYYRKQHWARSEKTTKDLGWWTSDDTKEAMFEQIRLSVLGGQVTLQSEALAKEFLQYVRINSKIEHVMAATTDDNTARGKAHGDRVIAFGVALMAARDRPLAAQSGDQYTDFHGEPPPGSMASRRREYDQQRAEEGGEWDTRDNGDLAAGRRTSPLGPGIFQGDLVGW